MRQRFEVRGETTVRWEVTVEADNEHAARWEALHKQEEATVTMPGYLGQESRVTCVKDRP